VNDIVDGYKKTSPGMNVHININPSLNVWGDQILIGQVLENLMSNAVKYTGIEKYAIINLSAEAKKDEIVIEFKDNGVGFNRGSAYKLFEPFQRYHSGEQFEGTGLGLATVKGIIDKHNGTISCKSEIGMGTSFTIHLPKT